MSTFIKTKTIAAGEGGDVADYMLTQSKNETVQLIAGDFDALELEDAIALQDGRKSGLIHAIYTSDVDLTPEQLQHMRMAMRAEFGIPVDAPSMLVKHEKVGRDGVLRSHYHEIVSGKDAQGRVVDTFRSKKRDELVSRMCEVDFGMELVPGRHNDFVYKAAVERDLDAKYQEAFQPIAHLKARARYSSVEDKIAQRQQFDIHHWTAGLENVARMPEPDQPKAFAALVDQFQGAEFKQGDRGRSRLLVSFGDDGENLRNANKLLKIKANKVVDFVAEAQEHFDELRRRDAGLSGADATPGRHGDDIELGRRDIADDARDVSKHEPRGADPRLGDDHSNEERHDRDLVETRRDSGSERGRSATGDNGSDTRITQQSDDGRRRVEEREPRREVDAPTVSRSSRVGPTPVQKINRRSVGMRALETMKKIREQMTPKGPTLAQQINRSRVANAANKKLEDLRKELQNGAIESRAQATRAAENREETTARADDDELVVSTRRAGPRPSAGGSETRDRDNGHTRAARETDTSARHDSDNKLRDSEGQRDTRREQQPVSKAIQRDELKELNAAAKAAKPLSDELPTPPRHQSTSPGAPGPQPIAIDGNDTLADWARSMRANAPRPG